MRVYGPMYMYLDYYPTYSDELPENFEKFQLTMLSWIPFKKN